MKDKKTKPYTREQSFLKRVRSYGEPVPVNYYFTEADTSPYPLGQLLPGHVYTFDYSDRLDESAIPNVLEYLDPKELLKYSHQKPYYDTKPICFSLGRLNDGPDEYVINLKSMPKPDLVAVLEFFFRSANQVIERYALNSDRELRSLDERLRNRDYVKNFATMNPDYFRANLGRSIYFWVNKYNRTRMQNLKLIDFDVLEKIARSDYSNDRFVKTNGHTMQEIHNLYQYVKNK